MWTETCSSYQIKPMQTIRLVSFYCCVDGHNYWSESQKERDIRKTKTARWGVISLWLYKENHKLRD
jgi:putative SOS response-associated peptidase YedK